MNSLDLFKKAIERLKEENTQLQKQLESRDKRLKEREVFIMNMMQEFKNKIDTQKSRFEKDLLLYKEKLSNQQKLIGIFAFLIF